MFLHTNIHHSSHTSMSAIFITIHTEFSPCFLSTLTATKIVHEFQTAASSMICHKVLKTGTRNVGKTF